jgi:hypothetical protein
MFYKYLFISTVISGFIGFYETYNADVIRSKDVINKILITEKISIISLYMISGFITLPLKTINYLNYFEIKYRKDDLNNYDMSHMEKKPKKLYDYMP